MTTRKAHPSNLLTLVLLLPVAACGNEALGAEQAFDLADGGAGTYDASLPVATGVDASELAFPVLADITHSDTRVLGLGREDPNHQAIDAKLATIPVDLANGYFSYPISDYSQTPDGSPYRFYAGAIGMGAIYINNAYDAAPQYDAITAPAAPGHYLYGNILEYWADQGYERGPFGYPRNDPQGNSQEFRDDYYPPGVDQSCLALRRHYVIDTGCCAGQAIGYRAWEQEVDFYYDSNDDNNGITTTPQQAHLYQYAPLDPEARAIAGSGYLTGLWCGAVPADLAPFVTD